MKSKFILIVVVLLFSYFIGCVEYKSREDSIPDDAVKITPESDLFPPILHSDEYETPKLMDGPINTAGAEDSPFIPCCSDDEIFYFFFTPDVRVPVEEQLVDGVTGIYVTKKINGVWSEPKRVILQDRWKVSLDGCTFVFDDVMWFCSARQGYTGVHWFKAEFINGEWSNWENSDFDTDLEVGELHFHNNWTELYYHSSRVGGMGGTDIWFSRFIDGKWQNPINIEIVNTEDNEGMPYITSDGSELWFNRFYKGSPGIFRSRKIDGEWKEPELIISQFAGEPTLDDEGNIYFVHHYYNNGEMIEADIYVAMKKI